MVVVVCSFSLVSGATKLGHLHIEPVPIVQFGYFVGVRRMVVTVPGNNDPPILYDAAGPAPLFALRVVVTAPVVATLALTMTVIHVVAQQEALRGPRTLYIPKWDSLAVPRCHCKTSGPHKHHSEYELYRRRAGVCIQL